MQLLEAKEYLYVREAKLMKKALLFIMLLLVVQHGFSQSSCAGAAPFCTASGTTFPASTGTTAPSGPNYGCLLSQPNPAWYYLNISSSGNIVINLSNSANVDIDFAAWGPFASQAAMCAGTSGSPFDCSYSTASTEQVNINGAVAGQWYMVLITNYANVPTNISATTGGGSSGTTNCAILCNMTGLTATPAACDPATNQYSVSGTITTTTPPTTGTLTITSSCGGSVVLNPPFGASINYTIPGITATGAGCSITATYSADPTCTLTMPYTSPAPCNVTCTINASNDGPVCAGGLFNLSTTAAGAGYSYSWTGPSFSSATQNPSSVTAPAVSGTYTYSVTATNGGTSCSSTTIVTVDPVPSAPVAVNDVRCGTGTVNLAVTGCSGTANWYTTAVGGSSIHAGSSYTTPSLSATTTYYVDCSVAGCTGPRVAVTATINPDPVVTVNSETICSGGNAVLTANGANSYGWNTGAVTNPITVSPASTTTYTVTGTSNGCSATAIATVTVASALVVDAGLNDTICYGASLQLSASPNAAGNIYSWSPAASLSNSSVFDPVASPVATTTYSVTVTDVNGCSGTDQVEIFVDPQLTIAKTAIDVTCNGACNGQTIVIPGGGTPTYSYSWTGGCTTASCSNLCPGSYTVTVTDALGCTIQADTTVSEPPALVPVLSGTTPASCNTNCDGTATVSASGGSGTYTYSWNTVPVQNTPTATGLCAGIYTCTITDANSCTQTITATITEPSPVTNGALTNISICSGGNANLNASGGGGNGGYNYSWDSPGNTGFSTAATVNVTPASSTTYTVHVTDVNGCSSPDQSVTVTVNPPLSATANGTASICPGASATISVVGANGNGGPYNYSWSPGAGTGSSISVNPTVTTTYTVTVTDGCSPAAIDSVTITVLPLPSVGFNANVLSGCAPVCVTFTNLTTLSGSGTITSWVWDFNDGSAVTQNPTHCFANAGQYTITLTTTSSAGCSSTDSISNMITVHANPQASFSAPLSASILNPVVPFDDNSTGASTWAWDFGDALCPAADNLSNLQNPSHTYSEVGTYCVGLTVVSAAGCFDIATQCVVIDPEFTFFIPNAFSPNGDGINDEFFGKGDFIKKFEMSIYDRWGNMLFYTDDIDKHWNGTANNGSQICMQDVYVYVVKLTDNKDKKHKYIGSVTLVQ
jgi:gliding motility-associated-like protein